MKVSVHLCTRMSTVVQLPAAMKEDGSTWKVAEVCKPHTRFLETGSVPMKVSGHKSNTQRWIVLLNTRKEYLEIKSSESVLINPYHELDSYTILQSEKEKIYTTKEVLTPHHVLYHLQGSA